jgi:hypothetical protein
MIVSMTNRFVVFSPEGNQPSTGDVSAPRLSDLEGKRVGYLWDRLFRGEEMFEEIATYLEAEYGSVAIPHERFGEVPLTTEGESEQHILDDLSKALDSNEVDCVVVGIAA